jgi:hypothetical protein
MLVNLLCFAELGYSGLAEKAEYDGFVLCLYNMYYSHA